MKVSRCRGNWGFDEKRQTEVAWSCGTKGRCQFCEGVLVVEGKVLIGRMWNTLHLLKVDPWDIHDRNKWRAIGRRKSNPGASGTPS